MQIFYLAFQHTADISNIMHADRMVVVAFPGPAKGRTEV